MHDSRPAETEVPVALVTGAADGIGQATAVAFAAAGHRLGLVDISAEGVAATAASLDSSPDARAEVIVADVTSEPDTVRAVAATVERFGRLDVLVNVVGGSRPGKTVEELTLDEWNGLLALNLTSTFLMCRAALPHLREHQGRIVNVSSGAGLRGMKANPGYVAAKAGVAALTRSLAIDHGPEGVRINAVAPGPIRTPLMRRNRTSDEIAAMGGLSLTGRIGEPEEIAEAIVWLAGPGASYLMGQTLEVDGGVATAI
ncbi:MAG: SDR family oxidoreductase [Acidimicrobiales bacterium]|nr:SDR family oxidoreductase [Acidimicrobiales bacterium]